MSEQPGPEISDKEAQARMELSKELGMPSLIDNATLSLAAERRVNINNRQAELLDQSIRDGGPDPRGEYTPEMQSEAEGMNLRNSMAVEAARGGHIERARDLVVMAHESGEKNVAKHTDEQAGAVTEATRVVDAVAEKIEAGQWGDAKMTLTADARLNNQKIESLHSQMGAKKDEVQTYHYKDDQGNKVTELIYPSSISDQMALVERWSSKGKLISARAVATKTAAFEVRGRAMAVKNFASGNNTLGRLANKYEIGKTMMKGAEAYSRTLQTKAASGDLQEKLRRTESEDKVPSITDGGEYGVWRAKSKRLEAAGVDADKINLITGRERATANRGRRRKSWLRGFFR